MKTKLNMPKDFNKTGAKIKQQQEPVKGILQAYKNQTNSSVTQLASKVSNISQNYVYNGKSVSVGKTMEAWLDPKYMPTGQSANLNTSQTDMMNTIRAAWNIKGGNIVKGHLLNDNLGGTALAKNLYPITRAANKDHLMYVENHAKKMIWNEKKGIYYKLDVDGVAKYDNPTTTFKTEIQEWDPLTDTKSGDISKVDIPSDLKNVSNYHEAVNPEDLTEDLDSYSNPDKPSWANKPKTKVSELSLTEKKERDDDK